MLIDWLTLRHPVGEFSADLQAKIISNMGKMMQINPAGELVWEKSFPDWEAIRSDSLGLYWTITADADSVRYLTIGASPSSLRYDGINVFGNLSLEDGAKTLLAYASAALSCILPHWKRWQCRRCDITCNYDMGGASEVKQALKYLLATDAPRRRTNSDSKGGDSVYWNPKSDLQAGKAYHKGAHLRMQLKKGRIMISEKMLSKADNLLRLELKLGARWWRRFEEQGGIWWKIGPHQLAELHEDFFKAVIGSKQVEVSQMGTLLEELEKVCPSKNQALAARATLALIQNQGYENTKLNTNPRTWRRHMKYLKDAGVSAAELCNDGKVIPLKKRTLVLGDPVCDWHEIRKVA